MANVTDTYYAGDAFIGYGAQFLVGQGDGSPETFVAVADVMEIAFGDMTTNVIPKTHLRSPGAHHEKIAALRDSGPFTLRGNYRPGHGSQNNVGGDGFGATRTLLQLWRNRTEANFQIELPDGSPATVLPFRGVVSKFQPGTVGLETLVDFTAEITPLSDFSADLP